VRLLRQSLRADAAVANANTALVLDDSLDAPARALDQAGAQGDRAGSISRSLDVDHQLPEQTAVGVVKESLHKGIVVALINLGDKGLLHLKASKDKETLAASQPGSQSVFRLGLNLERSD